MKKTRNEILEQDQKVIDDIKSRIDYDWHEEVSRELIVLIQELIRDRHMKISVFCECVWPDRGGRAAYQIWQYIMYGRKTIIKDRNGNTMIELKTRHLEAPEIMRIACVLNENWATLMTIAEARLKQRKLQERKPAK